MVAIVDGADRQVKELVAQIAAENFEVEIVDSFDRDVAEDFAVGAYVGSVEGGRRDQAYRACSKSGSTVRSGFTPT